MKDGNVSGVIFDIDTFAIHDGPGIRMAVYLKGCPLRCAWCHSPESQAFTQELIFVAGRCTECGNCVGMCPEQAHSITPEGHIIDRSKCTACGACVDACPHDALAIKGETTTSREIVEKAIRLKPFFDNSGGGVTLTGGEVTAQPEFTLAVLNGCRAENIHTAIETAGMCSPEILAAVSEAADLVLYDLKLIDESAHRRWIGAGNAGILSNLSALDPQRTVIRVPLIPDITDTDENIGEITRTAGRAGFKTIEYLPFNGSAGAKYEWLGRKMYVSEGSGSQTLKM